MEIKTKYSVGDKVWTVHKYPAGARVFEGKICSITVVVIDPEHMSIYYKIPGISLLQGFLESSVYGTREEAEQVRQDWIDRVNKADDDDD